MQYNPCFTIFVTLFFGAVAPTIGVVAWPVHTIQAMKAGHEDLLSLSGAEECVTASFNVVGMILPVPRETSASIIPPK